MSHSYFIPFYLFSTNLVFERVPEATSTVLCCSYQGYGNQCLSICRSLRLLFWWNNENRYFQTKLDCTFLNIWLLTIKNIIFSVNNFWCTNVRQTGYSSPFLIPNPVSNLFLKYSKLFTIFSKDFQMLC